MKKGAFTGAFSTKRGLLETAHQGTVLLDEIAEMPADMQVKLLRALQDGQVYRVGANQPVHLDIRVLAASNRDLKEAVRQGDFREDLYFRLNVMTLHLPRLRDREGDLWLLADHFLHKLCQTYGKRIKGFSPRACERMARYDYPGNVRELENIVAHAVALAENDEIQAGDLPAAVLGSLRQTCGGAWKTLEELEREHITQVLQAVRGHRSQAAGLLGITRSTLWRKMKKYGLAK